MIADDTRWTRDGRREGVGVDYCRRKRRAELSLRL